ncbi:permease prefix domain 2-containing transporter [Roseivirga sp. BDSF3-8]|uniref:permease prefix domain 2-containing transporter n=1 Tax=Roseivirga sp. BDSF3-8 TaxID=3241598 RepID=UPI003531D15C
MNTNRTPRHTPPRWATSLLRWYCDEDMLEEIQGDLEEAFSDRLHTHGLAYARRRYIQDVLTFIKPSVIQKFRIHKQYPPMFRNYLRIGLRSLLRKKYYALINSIGLILGLCCVCLAFLYLRHELSYDTFHEKSERTYRLSYGYRDQLYSCLPFDGFYGSTPEQQQQVRDEIKRLDGVEAVTHFVTSYSAITNARETNYVTLSDGKQFIEDQILYTNRGGEFTRIFDWPLIAGGKNALSQPYTAVISTTLADTYLAPAGDYASLIGQRITLDSVDLQVTGIMQDLPSYSHVSFRLAVNLPRIPAWGAYTYLTLQPGASVEETRKRINEVYLRMNPEAKDDLLDRGRILTALEDIHLQSDMLYELQPPGDVRYLYLFALAGLIILFITITNYTNLSVAMYAGRQKEVGLRKVMGAARIDVAGQFLFEAVLLTLICLPFALALLSLVLPLFNHLMGMELTNDFVRSLPLFISLFALCCITGLLSGAYPSLTLAGKKMSRLFHDTVSTSGRAMSLRQSLVGFQLILIIALSSGAWFIHQQMQYIAQKDLGFDEQHVLYFPVEGLSIYEPLRQKLLQSPAIQHVGTGSLPGREMFNQTTYTLDDREEVFSDGTNLYMDLGLVRLLGIDHPALEQLEQGKEEVMIVNQTAAAKLAALLPGQSAAAAIPGHTLVLEPEYVNEEGEAGLPFTIDGVIKDFHFFTLRDRITPMFLQVRFNASWSYNVVVRTTGEDFSTTLDYIESSFREVSPDVPFQVAYMDDRIAGLYKKERQISNLTTSLSLVAISLSVLGLLGLVSFMTYRRQNEISIRKVFGANVREILLLINREFIYLVGIATLIAAPLAWFGINAWLQHFAYHIQPGWEIIMLAGGIALLVVMALVSLQSLRTARRNPASVLRQE